jgi:lipoprotein-releasing system permease protein
MIVGIAISVTVLCTALNLFQGYEKTVKQVLLDSNSHIIVSSKNNNALSPQEASYLELYFTNKKEILSVNPVYVNTAMLKQGTKIRSVMIKAYPDLHKQYWFDKYITKGSLPSELKSVIIGAILAKDLGLQIGDKIDLLTTGPNSETFFNLIPRHESYTINGITQTGYYEADKSIVIMYAADAYNLYRESPNFSYMELFLRKSYIDKTNNLTKTIKDKLGDDFRIQSWIDFNGNLFSLITIEKWLIFLVFSFLILIASLNCISTVSTSIVDRQKEIAILRVLGVSYKSLSEFVFLRIIVICLIAVIVGLISGTAISYLITKQSFYQMKGEVYFIDTINMQISPFNYIVIFFISMLMVIICVSIPLKRLKYLAPVEVIRGK